MIFLEIAVNGVNYGGKGVLWHLKYMDFQIKLSVFRLKCKHVTD